MEKKHDEWRRAEDWTHRRNLPKAETWGTKEENANGRSIFIRLAPHVPINDLKELFDQSRITYYSKRGPTVVMQFKRPVDVSKAMEQNGKFLKGSRVCIEEFRPKTYGHNPRDDRQLEKLKREVRKHESTIRSRTPSRDRSEPTFSSGWDDNQVVTRHPATHERHQSLANSAFQPTRPTSSFSSSMNQQVANTSSIAGPIQYHNPLQSLYPCYQANQSQSQFTTNGHYQPQPVTDGRHEMHQESYSRRPLRQNTVGDLPSDIELTLKLAIEQKTARNLSVIQIQDVIRYFDYTKSNIERIQIQQQELSRARETNLDNHRQTHRSRRHRVTEASVRTATSSADSEEDGMISETAASAIEEMKAALSC